MLSDSVATRLRHLGLYAGGIQVTLRTPEFRDLSRQKQLSNPTHLIRELTAAAMDLTGQLWETPGSRAGPDCYRHPSGSVGGRL